MLQVTCHGCGRVHRVTGEEETVLRTIFAEYRQECVTIVGCSDCILPDEHPEMSVGHA